MRAIAEQDLEQFVDYWLRPARVAPPSIDPAPRTQTVGDLEVTVTPFQVEQAAWNQWRGEGARLVNNRVAHWFSVRATSDGDLLWVPEDTKLLVNDPEHATRPLPTPDDVILPLLRAALEQQRWGLPGDLVQRTRAAGPFRTAYLSSAGLGGDISGAVAFPRDDATPHVVAYRLTLAFEREGRRQIVQFAFD